MLVAVCFSFFFLLKLIISALGFASDFFLVNTFSDSYTRHYRRVFSYKNVENSIQMHIFDFWLTERLPISIIDNVRGLMMTIGN